MTTNQLNQQIQERIQDLAREIQLIVRRSLLDTLKGALDESGGARRVGRPRGARRATGLPRKSRGGRRSSTDVESIAAALESHIRANPGQTVTEIVRALGSSAKELRLPLQKLIAAKAIHTTGQRRGTRYHAGGKRAGKPAQTARKGRKRGRKAKRSRATAAARAAA